MESKKHRMTASLLMQKKASQEKIVMVTGYDYPTARLLDRYGVDLILVGDSVGTVVQGHDSTLPVTLDQMIYHAEMVARAAQHAMVVVDMPFPYCQLGPEEAVRAAARVIKETGAQAVKIEGGTQRAATISAVIDAGIPVMGHCGLMPQSIKRLGGYKIQRDQDQLMADVLAVQECGAFAVVLECIPQLIAGELTRSLQIPTIGIGAGPSCDGQVLVFHDLFVYSEKEPASLPKHARAYANFHEQIRNAVKQFRDDVQTGVFPSDEESF